MNCRRCGKKLNAVDGPACPHCGAAQPASKSGVMKSSTILISAGQTDAVYRSVKEVPAPLRRKLLKSTNGLNSATILIADRRGREEIARAIQNLPSSLQRRFLKPFQQEAALDSHPVRGFLLRPPVKTAIAWLLGAGSMLVIWYMFTHKW
jgi:hypothetical protein